MEQAQILSTIKTGSEQEQKALLKELIEWAKTADPEDGHPNHAFLQLLTNRLLGE